MGDARARIEKKRHKRGMIKGVWEKRGEDIPSSGAKQKNQGHENKGRTRWGQGQPRQFIKRDGRPVN